MEEAIDTGQIDSGHKKKVIDTPKRVNEVVNLYSFYRQKCWIILVIDLL